MGNRNTIRLFMSDISYPPLPRRAMLGLLATGAAAISLGAEAVPASQNGMAANGKRGKHEPNASHPELADRPGGNHQSLTPAAVDIMYRPAIHYSPKLGFMNDPNGLLHRDGIYHLYFQYDPDASLAGHVHWDHATSSDLYHWQDQPIAIDETPAGEAFTGSAVADPDNLSGLFNAGHTGMVAIYTRANAHSQTQWVATSLDGQTLTDAPGNPVLDLHSDSFRDPKVIFHAPSGQWVMVVALSRRHQIGFFTSPDLRHWTEASRFGPAGLLGIDYECPNLVELPVADGGSRWVLFVSINPGSPQGGSCTQYFVGDFDGKTFTADRPVTQIIDFAKDFYALQFYAGVEKPTAIAWMGNWQYCQEVPTHAWRGLMTLPREMSLAHDPIQGLRLAQQPAGLEALRGPRIAMDTGRIDAGSAQQVALPEGQAIELSITFEIDNDPSGPAAGGKGRGGRFAIEFSNDQGEMLSIGVDALAQQAWLDRSRLRGFSQPFFTGQFSTPIAPPDRRARFRIILDACSVEVFTQGGMEVGTALIYPAAPLNLLRLQASGSDAIVHAVELYPLAKTMERPTWSGEA